MHSKNKTLVISAVNFFEGGPLSVLKDCLSYLNDDADSHSDFNIIALVHSKKMFDLKRFSMIEFVEFPKARTSYLRRLYYEYFYFRRFAKKNNAFFWLSLHDITPNVGNIPQAVYCHNPSPFNSINFTDIFVQPTQLLFTLFYKYLYRINIHKNKYVIVQQLWIKEAFQKMFNLNPAKIIVAKPQVTLPTIVGKDQKNIEKKFFYPAFPRPFKNFEVICEAVKILENRGVGGFSVIMTIDGSENKYASRILEKYGKLPFVKFVGVLSREEVFANYENSDCLIFPSKLETWGLPISEYKNYGKSMIVSDLPYAKETASDYEKVFFFDPSKPEELADYMQSILADEDISYHGAKAIDYPSPHTQTWRELFTLLLN